MSSDSARARGPRVEVLAVIFAFSALTVLFTWPQVLLPAGIVPHQDSWFNMWRLGWVAHQLPTDPLHLFDANIYHPHRLTLAYSDAILLEGVLAMPLVRAGLPLPVVHTLLVLASFVFAGVATWALVRSLTGSTAAGVISGIVFAFTPFRFDHYMHMELLWTGWMPLCLLALHRAVTNGSVRAGAAAGLLFAAQTLSAIYFGVLFAVVLVPLVVLFGVSAPRLQFGRVIAALVLAALLSAVLLTAYMVPYVAARGDVGERSSGEAQLYSAGPTHYLAPAPGSLVYGALAHRFGRDEKRLFPGFVALALVAVALWPPWSALRVAFAAALLLAVDLSFGPRGLTFDLLRDHVMAFRGLRAAARAGGIALLMVGVLAGFGWARLAPLWRGARLRAAAACVIGLILLEYSAAPLELIAAPTSAPPVYAWLAAQPRGVVMEFPWPGGAVLPGQDAEYAYYSTFHWRPLVNGYSGNVPDSYVALLRNLRSFPDADALGHLHHAGVRYLLVHQRLIDPPRYHAITAALDRRSELRRHGPFGPPGQASLVYEFVPAAHE